MHSTIPDLLLIPGFMLDSDMWADLRPRLSEFGRVIDADTTRDATVVAMADRAIAALSRPTTVVGFSMGGYIARAICYRAPALVHSLVLIATSSRAVRPTPPSTGAAGFCQLSRAAITRSLHPLHNDPATISRIQAMSRRLGADVFNRHRLLAREDDTRRLADIKAPTVVVAAAQDELRSIEESEALHRGIIGSRFTIVQECGHLIPIERPAAVLSAIDAVRTAAA